MARRLAAIALALLIGARVAHGLLGLPDKPASFVTDNANLLPAEERASLEAGLSAFAASTSIEIAVVTVPSLEGGDIDTAAVELFEQWGIGDEAKDTGVLFLVALSDRKARIEVGYGLEGALPDATAYAILQQEVLPAFREERYADGIRAGAERIMGVTQGEALPYQEQDAGGGWGDLVAPLFVAALFGLQLLVSILQRSKSWWLGGVLGGGVGILVTALGVFGIGLLLGIGLTVVLALGGFLLDYVVSAGYVKGARRGGGPWGGPFLGGGGWGHGSGGGFGGFGGGGSGGGGNSGSW